MKTNRNLIGGSLRIECYDVYADYFVKYIKAYANNGKYLFKKKNYASIHKFKLKETKYTQLLFKMNQNICLQTIQE